MGSPFGLTWHRLGTICEQGISWGESLRQIISETASQTDIPFRRAVPKSKQDQWINGPAYREHMRFRGRAKSS